MIEFDFFDAAAMLMLASLAMFTIGYIAALVVPLHRRGHGTPAMRRLALIQMRGMQHAFAIAPLPARWRASAERQIAARMAHVAGHPAARRCARQGRAQPRPLPNLAAHPRPDTLIPARNTPGRPP